MLVYADHPYNTPSLTEFSFYLVDKVIGVLFRGPLIELSGQNKVVSYLCVLKGKCSCCPRPLIAGDLCLFDVWPCT